MARRSLVSLLLVLALAAPASAQDFKQLGSVTFTVDRRTAWPGGLMVLRIKSRRPLAGSVYAILNGIKFPVLPAGDGLRGLVPIPVTARPGEQTLGIEIRSWRGRQRIPLRVSTRTQEYAARTLVIPAARRGLLGHRARYRDGRYLLSVLRTVSARQLWTGPFRPPVSIAPVPSFGLSESWDGGPLVDGLMDSVFGEYHRGLDYPVPAATPVQAPAAGIVLLAAPLTLTGQTLLIDHGQGVVSAFFHLGRIDVVPGETISAQQVIGISGDSGLAYAPHVHWGVYVHGVAVDPQVLEQLPE